MIVRDFLLSKMFCEFWAVGDLVLVGMKVWVFGSEDFFVGVY